jgi:hypothetical protein
MLASVFLKAPAHPRKHSPRTSSWPNSFRFGVIEFEPDEQKKARDTDARYGRGIRYLSHRHQVAAAIDLVD